MRNYDLNKWKQEFNIWRIEPTNTKSPNHVLSLPIFRTQHLDFFYLWPLMNSVGSKYPVVFELYPPPKGMPTLALNSKCKCA